MSYISTKADGDTILVWERDLSGFRSTKEYEAPYFFYIEDAKGPFKNIYDTPLRKIESKTRAENWQQKVRFQPELLDRDTKITKQNCKIWEGDIGSDIRILSENYYNVPAPKLHVTHLDIEIDYDPARPFEGASNPYSPVNAIAMYHEHRKEMVALVVPHPEDPFCWTDKSLEKACNDILPLATDEYKTIFRVFDTEEDLLKYFLEDIEDSDLLSGWNAERFDFPYLAERIMKVLGIEWFAKLSFPEGNLPAYPLHLKTPKMMQKGTADYPILETSGRLLADYMLLYRKYEMSEKPSYKLASVADDVLVDEDTEEPLLPKLEYPGTLATLYRNNLAFFVRYNIRDTEILHGFEQKLGYIELANQMYHLSTGKFEHVLGTLKLAELAIINHCHHNMKRVVPNVTAPLIDRSIAGALVLYPQIGLHDLLGSIDINSLYPTAIRSLNISPEKIYGQFVEEDRACLEIAKGSDVMLTMVFEKQKIAATHTADEWRDYLWEKKLAVSGYGTVFMQDSPGIIPTVLSDWFTQRKVYQAKKKDAIKNGDHEAENYYDRLQYVYKIKLNSLYGALSNLYFRFYDLRMGESTTGTGRMILKHQCRKVNQILDLSGNYDVDFPLYLEVDKEFESDSSDDNYEEYEHYPPEVALNGPMFNGVHQSNAVIYGDSVTGDTIIDTGRGRKTISSLFTKVDYIKNGKEYCNLSTYIDNCESSLTYDKVNNITTYKPIKYVMRHKCSKQLYRVWITNSQWVDVTEDHSLIGYVNTKHRNKYNDFICEVKPQELGNDIKSLIYVKQKPDHNYTEQGFPLELYTLIGLVLGDGYVDTTSTGGVLLSIGSKHILDVEKNVLTPLKQEGWISSWTIKPNGHDVQISSAKLRKFLRQEMYPLGMKNIPSWIQCESIPNITAFLRGWFSADGFINNNCTVGLCSINEEHIKLAQELLFTCGISSTYFTETTENSFKGKYSGTYTKKLTVKSISKFRELVGFVLTDKQDRLLEYKEGLTKQSLSTYDFELIKPIKIEKLPIVDDYVYDIEVADTHTFFANNILVHNTDSTYFKTYADNIEDAIQIADLVAEKVNASYQDFMINTFLCQPEFDNLVKCGREVVADRGIFVEKKRYMLHLVDLEGKKVDKCKVMGLDTKKTTIPVAISKVLNKFIERMLKGETWDDISQSVVDYKQQLIGSEDVMDIGMPKGVNKLEDYTNTYLNDRTCRLPGHIAASIFYNDCLEHYGDNISMRITSGTKVKVFRLKGKYERFKSIAIPTDSEVIPEWFLDNYAVDKQSHMERLVDNPLKNILKAIGEKPPTADSLNVKSAWVF